MYNVPEISELRSILLYSCTGEVSSLLRLETAMIGVLTGCKIVWKPCGSCSINDSDPPSFAAYLTLAMSDALEGKPRPMMSAIDKGNSR